MADCFSPFSINLEVIRCTLKKSMDFFSKNDPYIVIHFHGKDYRTTTKDDAGMEAEWNETFQIEI